MINSLLGVVGKKCFEILLIKSYPILGISLKLLIQLSVT